MTLLLLVNKIAKRSFLDHSIESHSKEIRRDTIRTHCACAESFSDQAEVLHRTPALCYQTALGHIQVKHIHSVIDAFDLLHLNESTNQI